MHFLVKILVTPTKAASELQCCLMISSKYYEKLYLGQRTTPKYGAVFLENRMGIFILRNFSWLEVSCISLSTIHFFI